jgi:hypothetical protein
MDVEARAGDDAGRGALVSEIRQSFYLMGLMALVLGAWLGLGLLAVRVFG